MSQNGPWSGGNSDEPYKEPADPWSEQGSAVPDPPAWGGPGSGIPHQPGSGSLWSQPPPPPRRNTAIVALVVVLAVLVVIGLGTSAWLIKERNDRAAQPAPSVVASAPATSSPAPHGSDDARFYVKDGDCVINQGTDDEPDMRTAPCTDGTYQVL